MNRRDLLKTIALSSAMLSINPVDTLSKELSKDSSTNDNGKIKVIVCGGGFGGLTTAKYLKQFNPNLEVTVIEKNSHFVSCPYSNVWLADANDVTLRDLSFDYLSASAKFGYDFVNETIVDINRDKQLVITDSNTYKYDYLVLSTGIEYDYSKIFKDQQKAKKVYTLYPPAMKPGSEHLLLKRKVEEFKGGNFIINVPSGTYRCPPAPYERACMVAYYFKKNNIKGKVILIDPREKPGAKPKGFLSSFRDLYKEYIEYMPTTEIKDINFEEKYLLVDSFDILELDYVSKKIYFEDANIIPNMKPSALVSKAGLKLTQKGWAKLKEPTFQSVSDDKVYVVGDSGGHPYPKSAHMANSGGYIAAKYLAAKTLNKPFDETKELPANICYSMVNGDPKEGISVHHSVAYDRYNGLSVSAKSTSKRDTQTGETIRNWYEGITKDIFG